VIRLVPIGLDGLPVSPAPEVPDVGREACAATAAMLRKSGVAQPWIGYVAVTDAACVGTCAFKSAPRDGRVEIAYFTFPGHEGRGVATAMAAKLVAVARAASPGITVIAQTLPHPSASTRILERLGFERSGVVEHPEDGTVWEWELGADAVPAR
jgi:ribosomal-protein-alanine N-acetyltransferase